MSPIKIVCNNCGRDLYVSHGNIKSSVNEIYELENYVVIPCQICKKDYKSDKDRKEFFINKLKSFQHNFGEFGEFIRTPNAILILEEVLREQAIREELK
jgi:hypothetical protein